MTQFFAGIDFGTTNTTAAISGDGFAPKIVPIENNDAATPSTIFFPEKSRDIYFGKNAQSKYMDGDSGRFMRSLKRVLGTELMRTGTVINGRPWTFQSVIGAFIKNVKNQLDAVAGADVGCVVMGRPVHFRDNDVAADARAESELGELARGAGFREVLFQYEPIAAAFAHERHLQSEQLAAVIDIGGGTSDFTIIRLGGNRINRADRTDDILANTGVRIGGNDFDKQLAIKTFMPEFGMGTTYNAGGGVAKILTVPSGPYFDLSEWSRVNTIYTHQTLNAVRQVLLTAQSPEKYGRLSEILQMQLGHMVLSSVEDAKINLTDNAAATSVLDYLSGAPKVVSNRMDFERSISELCARVLCATMECVALAGVDAAQVQLIILTGGSTEIPYVRRTLCEVFPNATVSAGEKLSSVGLGLAFDAMRRFA